MTQNDEELRAQAEVKKTKLSAVARGRGGTVALVLALCVLAFVALVYLTAIYPGSGAAYYAIGVLGAVIVWLAIDLGKWLLQKPKN